MTTHSSFLAWRIPQTEEPSGLQSIGSQRIKHNRAAVYSTRHGAVYRVSSLCQIFSLHSKSKHRCAAGALARGAGSGKRFFPFLRWWELRVPESWSGQDVGKGKVPQRLYRPPGMDLEGSCFRFLFHLFLDVYLEQ